MADTIMQPTLEDIAQAFGLEPDAPLQPPRFAKVTAVADATVTVTLGTQTVEAVRCCVCSAGDVVLLETLPSGRLAAVGTRGATGGTTYTAGTGLTLSGTTINHSNAVTAGTIGTSSATSGATIAVPYATYDAQGHITARGTHAHTVNGIDLTSAVTGTLPIANGGTGATTALGAWDTLHNASRWGGRVGSGSNGYVRVATIAVNSAYCNSPITLRVNQRNLSYTVNFQFESQDHADPGVANLAVRLDEAPWVRLSLFYEPTVYAVKTATSTWEIWIRKTEAYDSITCSQLEIPLYYGDGAYLTFTKDFTYMGTDAPTTSTYAQVVAKTLIPTVVERGTSGIWTYEKWSDGTAKCWGVYAKSSMTASWPAWGTMYNSDELYTSFPSGLFSSAPLEFVNGYIAEGWSCWWENAGVKATTTSTGHYRLTRPTNPNSALTGCMRFYAVGRWR